jgi:hypothetical protein
MDVVEILKVGISGLVFLLALLGYRLLSKLTSSPRKPDTKVILAVRNYMIQTTFLAILVAEQSRRILHG